MQAFNSFVTFVLVCSFSLFLSLIGMLIEHGLIELIRPTGAGFIAIEMVSFASVIAGFFFLMMSRRF